MMGPNPNLRAGGQRYRPDWIATLNNLHMPSSLSSKRLKKVTLQKTSFRNSLSEISDFTIRK